MSTKLVAMNALHQPPSAWSTCRKTLCAAGLAALASSALADDMAMDSRVAASFRQAEGMRIVRHAQEIKVVKAEIPAVKSQKLAAWSAPTLPMSFDSVDPTADLHVDDSYMTSMDNFDTGKLFRTRKEMLYRDTLRLLLTKRQLRVWIRDDLHVQCEVKRWRTADDNRELGLKLGMYYRFD